MTAGLRLTISKIYIDYIFIPPPGLVHRYQPSLFSIYFSKDSMQCSAIYAILALAYSILYSLYL